MIKKIKNLLGLNLTDIKNIYLVMKITTLFLIIGCMHLSAASLSQTITLTANERPLEEIFDAIIKQTNYRVIYNDQTVDASKPVTVNAKNLPLTNFLKLVLKPYSLSYSISENIILIKNGMDKGNPQSMRQPIQQRTVTGKITDEAGSALSNVSVLLKGSNIGVVSDSQGNYSVKVPDANSILVFSFVGYGTVERKVGDNSILNIVLTSLKNNLDEVVVVGYGTMAKKQVTSAITSISAKDLPIGVGGASIATAMQGKVAGLVISGNASPNSGNTLQLRGVASVNAGQTPLVVIDGMPGGDIRSVVQEDIQSIDVLKDASAGAIYGTRAAAGVILITTKQASKDGISRLTYSDETSFKQVSRRPEVLSADEFREHNRGQDYGTSTDWFDALLKNNPISQKHVVNMQGGGKTAQIYGTFMYNDNQGVAVDDSRKDFGGRINGNFDFLEGWLSIITHVDYRQARRNNNIPNFQQALRNNPTRSPYDPSSQTGYNVWLNESLDYNVLADSKLYDYNGLDKWLKPDATIKLNILPVQGLSLSQTFGYDHRQWELHEFESKYHRVELENNRKGMAHLGFSKTDNFSAEGYATYDRTFDKHAINAVAGYSYFEGNGENFGVTNYNFSNDAIGVWNIGEGSFLSDGKAEISSNKSITERLFSLYARANYAYDDKYLATATIRHEGSSKFAINNRWGNFWSISGGWRISKENFLKDISWISDLKIRAAYGITGNNNFGADYAATLYGSDQYWLLPDGSWAYSYGKTKNINNDLKWEEKHEWNFGLDFSLLNDRLYGRFDLYRRKVVGLIYDVQVPQPPYVEQTMFENIGNLENKGWELELGGTVVKSDNWGYRTSMNFSTNKSRILTLWGNHKYYDYASFPSPGNPGNAIRIEEGTEIGKFYLWKSAGIDENGDFLLYNKDGKVIPASQKLDIDKQYLGNYMPKLIIAWSNNLTWKNWDLLINMRSWIDFDVYNTINMYFGLKNVDNLNVLKTAYTKFNNITGEKQLSNYFLENGTFLKIDALSLGYTLPLKKYIKAFNQLRIYGTVTNLATITGYSGLDPEVNVTGLSGGIEWFNSLYPPTRTYTLGVQLSF
ncbi:TonB-linked outer membrane protein, SusC/RagA family [bacterium A37T11]|nr:TonB-linked outer membrane protein, SusC/RagA family [bacterium A37T11]